MTVKIEKLECRQFDAERPLKFTPRTLTTADGSVSAIVVEGRRDPVVFIHGNSSTKSVWSHQIAAVQDRGTAVLAPDLPGHGDSRDAHQPETTYNIPGYASVITSLCNMLNWTSVTIVGWSLGGHIGLELLAKDDRVRSLLIVGAPPVPVQLEAIAEAFQQTEVMGLAGKRVFTEDEANAFAVATLGGQGWVSSELLRDVRRTHGLAREMFFASIVGRIGADERQAVETIDKPLCIVHGEKDPFIRLDYLQSLRYRALWRDRIFVIADAGHAPHWQCSKSFNEILLDFLGA
jgi:pimeloyl-ACP methyl ester carboxylesterase